MYKRQSRRSGAAAAAPAPAVPRARVVGGLVLLGVCGLALVAGSVRSPGAPLGGAVENFAGTGGGGEDTGNKQDGQPAPLACEAHLRSEMVFKGVEVTNMTSIQKSLLETVAEDAIGKVLNGMTGFQAMTAIWSYPVDGKCWVKFYFQVEFIIIPGKDDQDEISTGEELTNRAMRYLVKHIQNGDMADQWVDSNTQLGSETFLFGNITDDELSDYFDEEMSIYAVDEDTKLLWLETCTPPSLAPASAPPPDPPPPRRFAAPRSAPRDARLLRSARTPRPPARPPSRSAPPPTWPPPHRARTPRRSSPRSTRTTRASTRATRTTSGRPR